MKRKKITREELIRRFEKANPGKKMPRNKEPYTEEDWKELDETIKKIAKQEKEENFLIEKKKNINNK